jgi:hypothetical protein
MTEPTKTPAEPEPETSLKDRMSLWALMAVMVVTYVWFFSQALPHTS